MTAQLHHLVGHDRLLEAPSSAYRVDLNVMSDRIVSRYLTVHDRQALFYTELELKDRRCVMGHDK